MKKQYVYLFFCLKYDQQMFIFLQTVVSGLEEPDTIVLQKSVNSELHLKNITVGLKERKVVLNGKNTYFHISNLL